MFTHFRKTSTSPGLNGLGFHHEREPDLKRSVQQVLQEKNNKQRGATKEQPWTTNGQTPGKTNPTVPKVIISNDFELSLTSKVEVDALTNFVGVALGNRETVDQGIAHQYGPHLAMGTDKNKEYLRIPLANYAGCGHNADLHIEGLISPLIRDAVRPFIEAQLIAHTQRRVLAAVHGRPFPIIKDEPEADAEGAEEPPTRRTRSTAKRNETPRTPSKEEGDPSGDEEMKGAPTSKAPFEDDLANRVFNLDPDLTIEGVVKFVNQYMLATTTESAKAGIMLHPLTGQVKTECDKLIENYYDEGDHWEKEEGLTGPHEIMNDTGILIAEAIELYGSKYKKLLEVKSWRVQQAPPRKQALMNDCVPRMRKCELLSFMNTHKILGAAHKELCVIFDVIFKSSSDEDTHAVLQRAHTLPAAVGSPLARALGVKSGSFNLIGQFMADLGGAGKQTVAQYAQKMRDTRREPGEDCLSVVRRFHKMFTDMAQANTSPDDQAMMRHLIKQGELDPPQECIACIGSRLDNMGMPRSEGSQHAVAPFVHSMEQVKLTENDPGLAAESPQFQENFIDSVHQDFLELEALARLADIEIEKVERREELYDSHGAPRRSQRIKDRDQRRSLETGRRTSHGVKGRSKKSYSTAVERGKKNPSKDYAHLAKKYTQMWHAQLAEEQEHSTENSTCNYCGGPHHISMCAKKAFDKVNGQPGANATSAYRKYEKSKGRPKIEPSSRTKPYPTGAIEDCDPATLKSYIRDKHFPKDVLMGRKTSRGGSSSHAQMATNQHSRGASGGRKYTASDCSSSDCGSDTEEDDATVSVSSDTTDGDDDE